MAKSFKDFCIQVTTNERIDLTDGVAYDVDIKYKEPMESLVSIMKPRMQNLEHISIGFIQTAFEDLDHVRKTLDENTENGNVPDGLMGTLSHRLYEKSVNELTEDEQSIIKVLAVYLCIQNKI